MRISIVHAAMSGFDHNMTVILKAIHEILNELNVDIKDINLADMQLPLYDGSELGRATSIVNVLKESQGVIFATTSQMFAPCALMQTFIEHLSDRKEILQDKNCMVMAVSNSVGAKDTVDYLSKIVNCLGGYDSVKIAIDRDNQILLGNDDAVQQMLEKQIEDFYRFVGQSRKFFIPLGRSNDIQSFTDEEYQTIINVDKRPKLTKEELHKKITSENFTREQEQDIDEIAQLFVSKYSAQAPVNEAYNMPFIKPQAEANLPRPRTMSCKQLTQNLPHYFQTQLSSGYNFVVQISISGEESFEGYIVIDNNVADYFDGIAQSSDITILADSRIWTDILKGKHTAQKSFMIGQLKVRGNFVLLSRFEQLFKMGG